MVHHQFGGNWTDQKLEALKRYLQAYRLIFNQNAKARYLKTIYIDAFAGTGGRSISSESSEEPTLFSNEELPELDDYKKGSARIALELDSPFDEYIFVDKRQDHASHLETMIQNEYSKLSSRCDVRHGDGPEILAELCRSRDWKKYRAVVFLDPYGMNIEWSLLELIAATKAIDLWFLFPLGTGANRLLKRDAAPPKAFAHKLTRIFGTAEWENAFYKKSPQMGLFGEEMHFVNIVDPNFRTAI